MCLSCGCGRPEDAHGDPANITIDTLRRAAEAADITPEQAARNIGAAAAVSAGRTSTAERPDRADRTDDEPVVTEAHGSVM